MHHDDRNQLTFPEWISDYTQFIQSAIDKQPFTYAETLHTFSIMFCKAYEFLKFKMIYFNLLFSEVNIVGCQVNIKK